MQRIGVYVHFPFCLKKCPYCDFVSFARDPPQIEHARYASAVIAELERRTTVLERGQLETVFFGGGTPSLWDPREIARVLKSVQQAAGRRADDVEITVECNPSSLDEDRARALVDAGVNRLSVGVQGTDNDRLQFLGRLHDAAGGLAAVEAAVRAGVPRVSADFIFGVATESNPASPIDAVREVCRIAATGVNHISAYSLTIEPGTAFGTRARQGRLPLATDDTLAEAFFAVEEALAALGFAHYEISNYARPGAEARHNLGYWRGADYLGLGCAAVGTISDEGGSAIRTRNLLDPEAYMLRALDGKAIESEREVLTPEVRLRERIMLGLRLNDGVDLDEAAAPLGIHAWTPERRKAADRLVARGRLVVTGGKIRVPPSARIYADGIAADLF